MVSVSHSIHPVTPLHSFINGHFDEVELIQDPSSNLETIKSQYIIIYSIPR